MGLAVIRATLLAAALVLCACHPGGPASIERRESTTAERPAAVSSWRARTVRVQDGDSLLVRSDDGRTVTLRLSGIDAPERTQPHADVARRHLQRLLGDHPLEVRPVKTDSYGRDVAQVFVVDGVSRTDVGLAQLRAGMAWYFRRYERDLPLADRSRYLSAEKAARSAGTGLWSESSPEAPWDFRQREPANRRRTVS